MNRFSGSLVQWPSSILLFTLLVFCVLLAGASRTAAQPLTSQQRMDKLVQAAETYGRTPNGPNDVPNVKVAGIVATEDGSPLPQKTNTVVYSYSGWSRGGAPGVLDDGEFAASVQAGALTVLVNAAGYAPCLIGPRAVAPGEAWTDVIAMLRVGYRARVRLIDPFDRPVPGAQVKSVMQTSFGGVRGQKLESDAAGMIGFEHLSEDLPVSLTITAPGFQDDELQRVLQPGETLTLTLRPAAPARGVVTDRKTRLPIPNAEVFIACWQSPGFGGSFGDPDDSSAQEAAVADEKGLFTLDSLRDDTTYTLFFRAENHAPAFLTDVRAGEDDLRVSLGPPIYVKGRVLGSLDQLHAFRDGREVTCTFSYRVTESDSEARWVSAPLEIRDGVGHFEIADLWEGTLTIEAGVRRVELPLTKAVDDLVIDLQAPVVLKPSASRSVVIRLPPPEPVPPRGAIVLYIQPGEAPPYGETKAVVLNGPEERLDVPLPSHLRLDSRGMLGYWFETREKECDVAGDTLVWEVPLQPAGAIAGRVLDADGQPAVGVFVSTFVPPTSALPDAQESSTYNNAQTGPDGRFILTPLRFAIPYHLAAQRHPGPQTAVSKEITLDAATPLREIVLQFRHGLPVRGCVLLPDGSDAAFVPLNLQYETPWGRVLESAYLRTDRFGCFEIADVDFAGPGKPCLDILMRRDFRRFTEEISSNELYHVLVLEPGKTLKGSVTDQVTGAPVAGVVVYALAPGESPQRKIYADGHTDERGEFVFTRLDSTRYNLGVYNADIIGEPTAVGGQAEPVVIRVRKQK